MADCGEELHKYMADIVDIANQNEGSLFYDYYQAFFQRAATLLETYTTPVYWGIKDKSLLDSVAANRKARLQCVWQPFSQQTFVLDGVGQRFQRMLSIHRLAR